MHIQPLVVYMHCRLNCAYFMFKWVCIYAPTCKRLHRHKSKNPNFVFMSSMPSVEVVSSPVVVSPVVPPSQSDNNDQKIQSLLSIQEFALDFQKSTLKRLDIMSEELRSLGDLVRLISGDLIRSNKRRSFREEVSMPKLSRTQTFEFPVSRYEDDERRVSQRRVTDAPVRNTKSRRARSPGMISDDEGVEHLDLTEDVSRRSKWIPRDEYLRMQRERDTR